MKKTLLGTTSLCLLTTTFMYLTNEKIETKNENDYIKVLPSDTYNSFTSNGKTLLTDIFDNNVVIDNETFEVLATDIVLFENNFNNFVDATFLVNGNILLAQKSGTKISVLDPDFNFLYESEVTQNKLSKMWTFDSNNILLMTNVDSEAVTLNQDLEIINEANYPTPTVTETTTIIPSKRNDTDYIMIAQSLIARHIFDEVSSIKWEGSSSVFIKDAIEYTANEEVTYLSLSLENGQNVIAFLDWETNFHSEYENIILPSEINWKYINQLDENYLITSQEGEAIIYDENFNIVAGPTKVIDDGITINGLGYRNYKIFNETKTILFHGLSGQVSLFDYNLNRIL